jgi:hypothetical protein
VNLDPLLLLDLLVLFLELQLSLLERTQHLCVPVGDQLLQLQAQLLATEVPLQDYCLLPQELVLCLRYRHLPECLYLRGRPVLPLLPLVFGLRHPRKYILSSLQQAINQLSTFNILFEAQIRQFLPIKSPKPYLILSHQPLQLPNLHFNLPKDTLVNPLIRCVLRCLVSCPSFDYHEKMVRKIIQHRIVTQ